MKSLSSICLAFILFFANNQVFAGTSDKPKPKLVVGIVVDQMRYDYLVRYWDKFGNDGFKKLINQGYDCTNAQYNYVPTYTGPGHASIYTGTTPAVHGIISNDWYDRSTGRDIYVTDDSLAKSVGTDLPTGKMSPRNLLTTTFTDELRVATLFKSKVIGIALKDRGGILPAGHAANGAYWFDGTSGNWITSDWYMKELPAWAQTFNAKKMPDKYLSQPWNTLLPITTYTESTADDVPYEEPYPGETKPVFPHNFPVIKQANYELVRRSPFGNSLTMEFALAAMRGEELGKDEYTDVLAVSFSSTDYVGHQFGTNAIETEDTYLRLDKDLGTLIKSVEEYVGKENVLFFLTADHGAIPNPAFLSDHKIPAGLFNMNAVKDSLNKYLNSIYGTDKWVLSLDNDQVYLNHNLIMEHKLELTDVANRVAGFLMQFKGVVTTLTADDLRKNEFTKGIRGFVQNGFYPTRSGDVVMILEPGLIEYKLTGTTHGSSYTYDTHVPLLFYGAGIPKGSTAEHIDITDIAPTISQILNIQAPNGCTGKVILEVLK